MKVRNFCEMPKETQCTQVYDHGWQNAEGPTKIEAAQVYATTANPFPDQPSSDYVATHYEENIDAE
jgi:hypothetical protein